MTPNVLIVDDDPDMCAELERMLKRKNFSTTSRNDAQGALECLQQHRFHVVVTDLNMKGINGVELCDRIVQNYRDLPVIVITAFGSIETAVACMRVGAFDFLTKPFGIEQLVFSLERAIRHFALQSEVVQLRKQVEASNQYDDIIGSSPAMRAVYDLIDRVSQTDATVLVTGESGTGKELVARAIHRKSRRSQGPLVAINCAAMPETLLESELFGHTKGAFTDAKAPRRGLFLEASGGTLFLDELGEMPLGMQAKLLRALEDRKVRPVGGSIETPFDARLIVATNRDLESQVQEQRFREDLYYRVNVVHIELPPLRSRGHDILLLAQAFIDRMSKRHGKTITSMSSAVADKLLSYQWPGNVRELQNSIERSVALALHSELNVQDLPPKIREYKPNYIVLGSDDPAELITLEEVERRYIYRVMEAVNWSKTEATKVLGIDRSTLYRKLDKYSIKAPSSAKVSENLLLQHHSFSYGIY